LIRIIAFISGKAVAAFAKRRAKLEPSTLKIREKNLNYMLERLSFVLVWTAMTQRQGGNSDSEDGKT
jgi:hypothetical protein